MDDEAEGDRICIGCGAEKRWHGAPASGGTCPDSNTFRWNESREPVSDPSETLALIAEFKLGLRWVAWDEAWQADCQNNLRHARAATIGDAVRACVQRIRQSKGGPLICPRCGEDVSWLRSPDEAAFLDRIECNPPDHLAQYSYLAGGKPGAS